MYIQTTVGVKEMLFFFLSVTRATDGFKFGTEFLLGIIAVLPVQRTTPDHVKRKKDS